MIEDSTMAVIYLFWALLRLDWDDPLAKGHTSPGYAVTLSDTVVDHQPNGYELGFSWYTDQTIGPVQLFWDASVTQNGGIYAGFGSRMEDHYGPVFFSAYAAAGLWARGGDVDLGFPVVFRSGAEFGLSLTEESRIGIVLDHRSNADLGTPNAGIETIGLRFSQRF